MEVWSYNNYKKTIYGNIYLIKRCLLGKVGDLDIEDVHSVAKSVSDHYNIDKDKVLLLMLLKVVLFGGSHGGFITAWLLGKYPVLFITQGFL